MNKSNDRNSSLGLISIGMQLAVTVFIFVYGGYLLDQKYQTSPLWVALGAFAGMLIGFYQLIKRVNSVKSSSGRNTEDDEEHKKVKWL